MIFALVLPLVLAPALQAHEPEGGHVREEDLCSAEALTRLATEVNHASAAVGLLEMMETAHTLLAVDTISAEGLTLHRGDTVQTRARAGTYKPWSTGHPHEVVIAEGKTGTVVCFTETKIGPDITNKLAVVRWDLQVWADADGGPHPQVVLQPFEATINPSYLKVTASSQAPGPAASPGRTQ